MFRSSLEKEIRFYDPALFIDRIFPLTVRSSLRVFCRIVAIISALLVAVLWFVQATNQPYISNILAGTDVGNGIAFVYEKAIGVFAAAFGAWLIIFMIEAFYRARYFRGIETLVHEGGLFNKKGGAITFEVADLLYGNLSEDLTSTFIESEYGRMILLRLGILDNEQEAFVKWKSEREPLPVETIEPLPEDHVVDIYRLASHIFNEDDAFQEFLFSHGIQEEEFRGALEWVSRTLVEEKHERRWWSRDNLGRVSGIGRDWAYGGAYTLRKFAKNVDSSTVFSNMAGSGGYARDKVHEIEEILLKSKEANALIIGEEGVGKMDVVLHLYSKLKSGKMLPPISDKQLIVLDTNLLVSLTAEKGAFERTIRKIFTDAIDAGNIILVIENIPSFVQSVSSLGSNAADLIDSYLSSPHLQVIGTATPEGYHATVEAQAQLVNRFDSVYLDAADQSSTIKVLENLALQQEAQMGHTFFFTYPAIKTIAESAERYIVEGVMPDKAIDLLLTVSPHVREKGSEVARSEDVLEVVEQRTGVPVGKVEGKERKTLTNLEDILHERVIGQDEAIEAVSGALRRARAGVRNPDRPIGSFLFLGPTGVGKTETTKALADAYFGGEDEVQRIDMSEYSTPDSLERLIGSYESDRPGTLSNMARENPYGVLLLDEFEKADTDVHDLFLQILDEGFFSDMRGRKVNVRNMIIIATSNAGSDMIFRIVDEGDDLSEHKDDIINNLIDSNIYKPELINRFDAVVMFTPLPKEDLEDIAEIQLQRLKKRVKERGYELVINQPLIDLLVEKGYDPKFGARPMNRVIQEDLEEAIAEKIITDQLKKGSTIEFTPQQVADYMSE